MTINTQETVGQLATVLPGATRIFEQFGIDYCCGGKRTLSEACQNASLEVERVIHSLEEAEAWGALAGQERDWRSETLTTLAAYIVDTHHFFTKQELIRLEKLIAKVCQAHGGNHSELLKLQELFQELKQDLLPHMLKEEQVLFPYIARLEEANYFGQPAPQPFFGTVNNPVRMMTTEHDRAGELLRAMRTVTGDYAVPGNACASYRALYRALPEFEADLHQHIHLENNILFPRAVELETQAAPERQQAGSEYRCVGH
jgi:regulator of cell morphogenesis and NO signaling